MAKLDPRVGTRNDDGSIENLPEVNMVNQAFEWPATTFDIDARHFVILPNGLTVSGYAEMVDEAVKLAPPSPAPAPGNVGVRRATGPARVEGDSSDS